MKVKVVGAGLAGAVAARVLADAGHRVHLQCSEEEWRKSPSDHLIFTGSIDDYFSRAYGILEYRSLNFEYSTEPKREHFQINECNRVNPWTRAVDHSHWLDQNVGKTVVAREYPL